MIHITGDTHSDFTRFSTDKFLIQNEMSKNDYLLYVVTLEEYGIT